MPSELDLLRSAHLMLVDFGDEAALECTIRATACLEKGDHQGHRVWLEIVRALGTLEATEAKALH